jgi:hypothetical protein
VAQRRRIERVTREEIIAMSSDVDLLLDGILSKYQHHRKIWDRVSFHDRLKLQAALLTLEMRLDIVSPGSLAAPETYADNIQRLLQNQQAGKQGAWSSLSVAKFRSLASIVDSLRDPSRQQTLNWLSDVKPELKQNDLFRKRIPGVWRVAREFVRVGGTSLRGRTCSVLLRQAGLGKIDANAFAPFGM